MSNLQQLEANYQATKKPVQKQRSGFSKWLPAAGAVAGGLALAPLTGGTSLLATAALLGGGAALGGAAGEFGAEKVNKEKTNVGRIAKEGLISGATGAIPIGGVAKTARIASQAAKVGTEDAGAVASRGLVGRVRDNIGLHGQQLEGRSGGYAVNAKLPGSNNLDIAGSKGVDQVLQKEGVKAGSPLSRLKQVEDKLGQHGSKIDEVLTKSNVKLTQASRQGIAKQYLDNIEKLPGVDETVRNHAKNIADNFVKNGGDDVKGLVNFRRGLDKDTISYIANPDAALAGKQQAAKVARQTLSGITEKLIPAVKEPNQAYSKLVDAKGYLTKGSGEMNTKGGLVGRFAESGPIKTAESLAGRAAQKVGGTNVPVVPERSLLSRVSRETGKQAIGQTVGGESPVLPETPVIDPALAASATPDDPSKILNYQDPNTVLNAPPDQTSGMNAQLLEAAKQALANGDTKGLANIATVAGLVDKLGGSAAKPVGATQQQQANNAQSGLQSISDLSSLISKDRGLVGKSGIPGQSSLIGGFESRLLGTGEYNTAASNIRDVISRLRSGAALTTQEEKRYTNLIPKAGDDDSTISYKLNALQSLFSKFAQPAGGTDIQDLLANSGVQ